MLIVFALEGKKLSVRNRYSAGHPMKSKSFSARAGMFVSQ